jgi:hypothetical protein
MCINLYEVKKKLASFRRRKANQIEARYLQTGAWIWIVIFIRCKTWEDARL